MTLTEYFGKMGVCHDMLRVGIMYLTKHNLSFFTLKYLMLFIVVVLLSGCNQASAFHQPNQFLTLTSHQIDGAPPGKPPTHFEQVKPVKEPLSRYGNPLSYKVQGKRYAVMKSASGYKAKGIASWYGTKFHKKRTSSGERYNMYSMTAAHKTLPLPTYLRVKNLKNGRETIVKVNDRGPFRSNRILDLSYAAATKLGILSSGLAPVEIEAITPDTKKSTTHYYVQAGAFTSKTLAHGLEKKIKKLSKSPVLIEKYKQHFVVKIGPFQDKNKTESIKKQLIANDIKGTFTTLQS